MAFFPVCDAQHIVPVAYSGTCCKKKGLLLVYPNENGYFNTVPIRVYDQFNFLLSLLQSVDNYFIVPFTNKNEMGLMKVSLNN